jgi:hypothetical protein
VFAIVKTMLKMLTPVGRDPKMIADGISAFVSSTRRESRSFAPINIDLGLLHAAVLN